MLLSVYRFAPKAREELLSTLRTLGNRVWVPHQVGLEFHRNRLEVMAERRATYDTVLSANDLHKQTAQTDLEGKIRSLSRSLRAIHGPLPAPGQPAGHALVRVADLARSPKPHRS